MEEANGYAFTNAISTFDEARPFSSFIQQSHAQTVIIIYANNSWGDTQRKIYGEMAAKQGVKIVQELPSVSFDQNEWRTFIPSIRRSNPDLLLLLLNKNDLELFLKRASEVQLHTALFASKNAYDAFRSSGQKELYEDLCFTYPYERLLSQEDFAKKYQKKFGEAPRIYADNTYDALFLLSQAYALKISSHHSFRDALMQTKYLGLVGHYEFSPLRSFQLGTSSLLCVEDHQLKLKP